MYLAVSLLVFIISLLLFNYYGASLNPYKLNLISYIFWFQIILECFIASLLVIYNLDNHYIINRAGQNSRFWGWLFVSWTMIGFPLGLGLASFFLGGKKSSLRFSSYCDAPVRPFFTPNDTLVKIVIHLLLLISVISTLYVFYVIRQVPLFEAIKSPGSALLASLRISASRNFGGNQYIRNIGSYTLSQIISYICYAYYKLTKKKIDKLIFILSVVNAVFAVTYNLAKAPVFFYFLGFLFLWVLLYGRISRSVFIITGLVVVIGIIGAYALTMGNVNISALLFSYNSGITGRIILSQAAGTYLSFELFPQHYDFIGIRSLSRWLPHVFGLEYSERSSRLIMEYINPRAVAADTAGVVNTLFVGEAWANFGLVGAIFSPLIAGLYIGFIFQFFLKLSKNPVYVGVLCYLSLNLPGMITGGFNEFIYPISILIILFIVFLIKYGTRFLAVSARTNRANGMVC
jgi:oligosaccharide repeat unit polymerase